MVADKKIPLLTEVYQPKPNAQPTPSPKLDDLTLITPELIARVTGHVRPRLEAEITQSVMLSMRDVLRKDILQDLQAEIKSAQIALETNTNNYIDRTKADLKTELPQMYQNSADLVYKSLAEKVAVLQTEAITNLDGSISQLTEQSLQVATSALQSTIEDTQVAKSAQVKQEITVEMQAFQADATSNQQTLLRQEMTDIFESANRDAKSEMQMQLDSLQTDAITQLRASFTEAMPAIYTDAIAQQQEQITAQISQQLHQEMQTLQAESLNQHQVQLAQSIEQLQTQLTQSISSHQTLLAHSLNQQNNQLTQSIDNHQTQLAQSLTNHFESLSANAKDDLTERLNSIQTDAVEQMRSTLIAAIPSIYGAAGEDVKAKFADEMTEQSGQLRTSFLTTINAELPAVQAVMRENIQQILATTLPKLELDLRNQLTEELQALLLKVKFVLPN
ncbi:MAG: hypothetical protein H7Z20_09855 [Bdellovibrio sp.]|nr:hypothetical protein [Methylotenera sp.]